MKLYTTKEIGEILNLSVRRVRELILDKSIKASAIGRSYLIRDEDLNDFINSRQLFNDECYEMKRLKNDNYC
jgi:excisionase family DNA binding protein